MNLPNKPKVLAATYNPISKTKMISFLVDFPTVLLAELRTHRILTQGSLYEHSELNDFNLSANSARAIPANKYLQKIKDNSFIPIWTGKQSGMSGSAVTHKQLEEANHLWLNSLQNPIANQDVTSVVNELIELGIHKQNCSRLLAPYAYTTCIISGTEFENFFELRCPKYTSDKNEVFFSKKAFVAAKNNKEEGFHYPVSEEGWNNINKSSAQPEFQVIAEMLYDLYQEADWKESKYHIPFIQEIWDNYELGIISMLNETNSSIETFNDDRFKIYMKISASMCAKLSYNTQDNEDTLEKHLERANMLIEHKHSEPFSHQAVAMDSTEYFSMFKVLRVIKINDVKSLKVDLGKCYNLTGFISQRYILENY
jgi:hypothetical protein